MKTLLDYDEIPYSDCPITVSRPDNLYFIGRLFHLQPATPENCKVLELGCAGGGNLIPLAYYWPRSEFVGVELSQKQAESATRIIEELQLKNIRVVHADLTTLDHDFGQFDYIIAHGVYSWVPPAVQQHLLKLCKLLLKPQGIAYISYNTLPGWEQRKMLRDMMLYHTRSAANAAEQLDKSLELLQMLYQGLPEDGSMSERWLKEQAKELLNKPPGYVYHDYLEKYNTPVYFHQFAQAAADHQLKFFAEASLYTMLSSSLSEKAETALDQFQDPVDYEQYMDFFYIKHFRQSLLCHAQLNPQREIHVEVLKEGYFYAFLYCNEEIDLFSPTPQTFLSPSGDGYSVCHPLTKAALAELLIAYPNVYTYAELESHAVDTVTERGDIQFANQSNDLFAELVNLYLSAAVNITSIRRASHTTVSNTPKFNTLTRAFCRYNKYSAASVHHDSVPLSNLQCALIKLADGTRNLPQIADELNKAAAQDTTLKAEVAQMLQSSRQEEAIDFITEKLIDTDFVKQAIAYLAYHGFLDS
jgi:SAM-dependent methyltransferase